MERKKPTNKEIVAKVEMLTNVNNIAVQMIENIGNSLKQYIEFKKDTADFHEYQKEILEIRKKITGEDNGGEK
jgi:predicted nucleic-acid-binding protein